MFSRPGVKRAARDLTKARGPGCLPEWLGGLIVIVIIIIFILSFFVKLG